jgi:hypothetical protein
LTTQLQQLTNKLTSLVYQNVSAPNSVIATGGITNEIAGASRIDQLSGVAITVGTITNATINGISGLTGPQTDKRAYGVVVPMPTLPPLRAVSSSVLPRL